MSSVKVLNEVSHTTKQGLPRQICFLSINNDSELSIARFVFFKHTTNQYTVAKTARASRLLFQFLETKILFLLVNTAID